MASGGVPDGRAGTGADAAPGGGGTGGAGGPFGRLLHLGNVVVDVVLPVPALPPRGGDVLASRARATAGGGFNVMAAAARQGMRVSYAGAHGSGPFADLARAALAAEGIEAVLPARPGLDTGLVVTMVEPGGERTFLTSPGAEATLSEADLAAVVPGPRDAVCLSGYGLIHPANRAALLWWLAQVPDPVTVVFDPGPLVAGIPAEALAVVLARADWLTCNQRESFLLTGEADPASAARALARREDGAPVRSAGGAGRAGGAGVLVRTGPAGCLLAGPSGPPVHVPGFPVVAVDTTGAGDTHTGCFLAALAAGEPALAAVRRANAAAALSVTRWGPATAPARQELARFLAGAAAYRPGPR